MKKIISWLFLVALLATAQASFAQEQIALVNGDVAPKIDKSESKEKAKESKDADTKPAPAPQATKECKLCRWFELTNATLSFRYRTITDSFGTRTFNQGQHREIFDGRFKFDKAGKYTINAHASSGYYFNWAYADSVGGGMKDAYIKGAMGLGVPRAFAELIAQGAPNSGGYNLFVRQLYFSAKPVKGLEIQFGSLPILHGQNSETTSYDDDGYVAGERVSVKRPDKFFFDEISATYGFIGKTDRVDASGKRNLIDDVYTPNFFRRVSHLGTSNYHQFLVQKKLGTRATVSADYTFHERTDFMREAVKVNVKESKVLDWVRFEAYQRIGDNTIHIPGFGFGPPVMVPYKVPAAKGFSIHGEKKIGSRFSVGGGYNDIDYNYSVNAGFYTPYNFALNGDRNGVGKRYYFTTELKLSDEFSVTSYMSNAFAIPAGQTLFNKSHINVAVTFDLLKSMQKHFGWFK